MGLIEFELIFYSNSVVIIRLFKGIINFSILQKDITLIFFFKRTYSRRHDFLLAGRATNDELPIGTIGFNFIARNRNLQSQLASGYLFRTQSTVPND